MTKRRERQKRQELGARGTDKTLVVPILAANMEESSPVNVLHGTAGCFTVISAHVDTKQSLVVYCCFFCFFL